MKKNKYDLLLPIGLFLVSALGMTLTLKGQFASRDGGFRTRRERFTPVGTNQSEAFPGWFDRSGLRAFLNTNLTEALTGFDNLSNGLDEQGPDYDTLTEDNVVALRSFNDNRFIFDAVESIADGVGPTYNAQSCRECHQNVVSGGASQVTVHRSGRIKDGVFFDSLGGSLIHSRATHPDLVEHAATDDSINTFRISPSTLGDGYVESIANSTLIAIRDGQPNTMRGNVVMVPILEANSAARVGRFGWKAQHASLESFAAGAYLNEMGITTPLLPEENTSNGKFVGLGSGYDFIQDPEDDGEDVVAFANFMRATKAPSRGVITSDALAGQRVFDQVGCTVCHVAAIATAPPGTLVSGGSFVVPNALGNKIIRPYSDFLLHNVATGDGIPVSPLPQHSTTTNQMRTAPLWGLRTRNRLMHDGLSFTKQDAIRRHGGQAASVTSRYNNLSATEKAQLMSFLDSL